MKRLVVILFLLASVEVIQGQVTGLVVDEMNNPLEGVNLILQGTNFGTATNAKGIFILQDIPDGSYRLKISAIGFKTIIIDPFVLAEDSRYKFILEEEAVGTEQVVVTAGKYQQKLEDLSVSTAVIQPKTFSKQNLNSIDQALRYIPGITMALDQVSIRGSSGYSKGAGTRVLVAIDGIPLYTADTGEVIWEMIPLTDIERIEIIKGPASSLYGSTAIGGVINIISKKPSGRAINHFKSYYGMYDNPSHDEWEWSDKTRSFHGMSFTRSNSLGNIGYTFSLKKLHDDSYRENDFNTRIIGYTKINYDINEKNQFSLIANYMYMNRGNYLYWKDSHNVLRPKDDDRDQTVESNRIFLSGIFQSQLNNKLSLSNKTSFYRSKFTGKGIEITTSTSYLIRNEILGEYSLNNNATIILGNEISYAEVESNMFSAPNFFSTAFYGQAEYKGFDKFTLSAGLRYDYMKLDSLLGASALTPKVGVNYKVNSNLILRTSFGTGFRAPTPAEVFTSQPLGGGVDIVENPDLEAETSISFEVGAIIKPFNRTVIDIALFNNNYKNYIEPTLMPTNEIKFVNIVTAKIQGVDLSVNYDFDVIPLTLNLGYNYLWARDTDLNRTMKYRPRNTFNVSINYTPNPFDLGVYFRYLSKIESIDDALWQPPISLIPDGDLVVPIYVLDVSLGYYFIINDLPLKIYLNGKNLLNYNYVEFIGNLAPIRRFSLSIEAYF